MNIYIGNLEYSTKEDELQRVFEEHGQVTSVKIIRDKFTGKAKGFAFLEMANDAEADNAIHALNGKEVNGRQIKVSRAVPPKTNRRY